MAYVDKEKVCGMFNRFFNDLKGNKAQVLVGDMKQAFLELPTADVVEVVRCGQCKYYDCGRCNKHHIWIGDLNFCSYGERTPQKEG